jgi:hypothetical protein
MNHYSQYLTDSGLLIPDLPRILICPASRVEILTKTQLNSSAKALHAVRMNSGKRRLTPSTPVSDKFCRQSG